MSSEKYIGLDVHQATISVAVIDSQGKVIMESILETKASTILEFFAGLRGSLFVTFEEGTWAAWLYDLLKPHVTEVLVCNPRIDASGVNGNVPAGWRIGSGSYTVNADCTGTETISFPGQADIHVQFVVAQSGNKLHYVNVDAGISLSGEVERFHAPKSEEGHQIEVDAMRAAEHIQLASLRHLLDLVGCRPIPHGRREPFKNFELSGNVLEGLKILLAPEVHRKSGQDSNPANA